MANGVIGKVTAGGGTHLVTSTFYGTCATAANTVAKIVKLADTTPDSATLITGMTLAVKFTYSNTAANPTLTVQRNANTTNLIAAKSIKQYGTTAPGTTEQTSWRAGAVVLFIYDGTNWVMVSTLDNNTTYDGEKGITLSSGKFGHSNTAITAQSTQAVYPIKIDAYGHITGYGSAVTIPSAVSVKGNAESSYRTGQVNLTPANLGISATTTSVTVGSTTFNQYVHPTTAGNTHIPASGSSGQLLIYGGSSGTASWGTIGSHSVTTPTGSTTRTADVALNTTTVNSITAVGTLPSLTVTSTNVITNASVTNEVLSFTTASIGSASGWSAGTLPTKGSNTTVATTVKTQPTFTVGTQSTTLTHSVS